MLNFYCRSKFSILSLIWVSFQHRVPIASSLNPRREGRQVEIIWTRKLSPSSPSEQRAIQPNNIKIRTRKALAPMWTPPINESAKLTRGALWLIQYSSLISVFGRGLLQLPHSHTIVRNGSGLNHSFCINQQVPSTFARSLQFHGQLRVGMNVEYWSRIHDVQFCWDFWPESWEFSFLRFLYGFLGV